MEWKDETSRQKQYAVRLQNSPHFRERFRWRMQMLEDFGAEDDVKRCIRKHTEIVRVPGDVYFHSLTLHEIERRDVRKEISILRRSTPDIERLRIGRIPLKERPDAGSRDLAREADGIQETHMRSIMEKVEECS